MVTQTSIKLTPDITPGQALMKGWIAVFLDSTKMKYGYEARLISHEITAMHEC